MNMDDFWQKWQAIFLGQNMVFLGTFEFVLENEASWNWTIFGKTGKPIALLFGQNMMFFGSLYIVLEIEERWIWMTFGKNGKPFF